MGGKMGGNMGGKMGRYSRHSQSRHSQSQRSHPDSTEPRLHQKHHRSDIGGSRSGKGGKMGGKMGGMGGRSDRAAMSRIAFGKADGGAAGGSDEGRRLH